jgi:hypothetical protein
LIHHPRTTERIIGPDFRLLLSDPTIMDIFDTVIEIYHSEGPLPPEAILDRLEREASKERFREVMLKPPICRENEVDQALKDFEDRVQRIKISDSKRRAMKEGDMEGLRKIPKRIKERWG